MPPRLVLVRPVETISRLAVAYRHLVKELSAFGVVGATCFLIDVGLFQLLYTQVGAGAVTSKFLATTVSMTVAYVGHRYWSFSHRARPGLRQEYARFTAINVGTLLFGLGVVAFVRYGLDQESALVLQIANVGSIVLGTLIRYLSYRRWVFPAQAAAEDDALARVARTPV
jgi:putative flippase GtrA